MSLKFYETEAWSSKSGGLSVVVLQDRFHCDIHVIRAQKNYHVLTHTLTSSLCKEQNVYHVYVSISKADCFFVQWKNFFFCIFFVLFPLLFRSLVNPKDP